MDTARWDFWLGLGITILSAAIPYTGAPVPHVLGWIGVFVGVVVMLWPVMRHPSQLSLSMFSRYLPLEAAAQIAYESIERTGLDDMTRTNFSDPDVALRNYRFMLIYNFDDTELVGIRQPSKLSLPIPRSELRSLNPTKDSKLEPINDRSGPGYYDVKIKRRDMRRAIRKHLALLRRNESRRESHA